MQLTVDGVTHHVDVESMPFDEACEIEDVTGLTIGEWSKALTAGSAKAIRALALVLVKRVKPETRLADIGRLDFADFLRQMAADQPSADTDSAPAGVRAGDPSAASV